MTNKLKQTCFIFTCIFFFGINATTSAQELTGKELLEKSINFHDPTNTWSKFNGKLKVTMSTPKGTPRVSDININLQQEYFSVTAVRDTISKTYTLDKGVCTTSIKEKTKAGKSTPCETAEFYKNYYTYLYGLPMKLKDEGTNISEKVKRSTLNNKEYLVLEAKYDQAVGSDVWYFYFDPTTYAMEAYQFYKSDNGTIKKDSGEYILLSEITTINNIKFPKERAWYYNSGGQYLGTDILN